MARAAHHPTAENKAPQQAARRGLRHAQRERERQRQTAMSGAAEPAFSDLRETDTTPLRTSLIR